MRTRWRFGSQRRFEATIECERWLPNDGFFPQIAQIFDIAGGIVAEMSDRELGACGDGSAQAARSGRAQGIAVPTFNTDPGEMRSVSEPPSASARIPGRTSRLG